MKLFVVLLIALICVSADAANSRAKLLVKRATVADPGDENSHSTQATVDKKLGFAFVLDNGNDIETVHETKTTHKMLEENKKQGIKESAEKQKKRENDYNAVLERVNKENQEFTDKLTQSEAGRKKAAEESTKQGDEAASEEKNKRNAEFAAADKSEAGSKSRAEQQQKSASSTAEQQQKAAEAKARDEKNGLVRLDPYQPVVGNVLLGSTDAKLQFTGAYTYAFFVRPTQAVGNWANLFHKGQDNVNRNPAIWFYPGQTRLHCRSGTNANPNWENGGNNGCDPDDQLPLNQWTHVALVHDNWGIRVYLNGAVRCQAGIGAPVGNSGPLYSADPWHDRPAATIANVRILNRKLSDEEIKSLVDDKRGTMQSF